MPADKPASPVTATDDGVAVALRVTPKARAARIGGTIADADGSNSLKVSVTAAPENGKANAAVIALLSKSWGIPKSHLAIISGATSRRKILRIKGNARELRQVIDPYISGTEDA